MGGSLFLLCAEEHLLGLLEGERVFKLKTLLVGRR
jgi:hypothetical protein